MTMIPILVRSIVVVRIRRLVAVIVMLIVVITIIIFIVIGDQAADASKLEARSEAPKPPSP